jgi:hypothetical protein
MMTMMTMIVEQQVKCLTGETAVLGETFLSDNFSTTNPI